MRVLQEFFTGHYLDRISLTTTGRRLTIPSGCPDPGRPACRAISSSGYFNQPFYITVDPSGNVWVADNGNNRVEEFNSGRTFITPLGWSSGACSSGSGNGQFDGPNGIAADAGGNTWVVDAWNQRLQEFNSSGA
ncbi:MAG: hypothetical protein ACRD3T_08880 [Terriglobia bacterium]